MDIIFMTFEPHKLLVSLSGKISLKSSDEYVPLSNLSIYSTRKFIKNSYTNKKIKISVPILNEKF